MQTLSQVNTTKCSIHAQMIIKQKHTYTNLKQFSADNPFNSADVKKIFIYKIAATSAAVLSAGLQLREEGGFPPLNHNFPDLEGGYETTSKRKH